MCAISVHMWVKYKRVSCGVFMWCIRVVYFGEYTWGLYLWVFMWGTYLGNVVYGYDVGDVGNRMDTGFVTC